MKEIALSGSSLSVSSPSYLSVSGLSLCGLSVSGLSLSGVSLMKDINAPVDGNVVNESDIQNLSINIIVAQELKKKNDRFTLFVQYAVRASLVLTVILMAVCIPGMYQCEFCISIVCANARKMVFVF
jgi:hypothetical protein